MSTLDLEEKNEKAKKRIPRTFKEQAISSLRSRGRSTADIERELGITPGLTSRWNRKKAKPKHRVIEPHSNHPLADKPLTEQVKQPERQNARWQ